MRDFVRWLVLLTVLIATVACDSQQQADSSVAEELLIEAGWVRPMPPSMRMTAGYARLRNVTDQAIELCEVTSPSFGLIELHRTEVVDGMARMRQQLEFLIKPDETIVLEPGGLHLMLMRPSGAIAIGETITFEVVACDQRRWSVTAPVGEPQ